MTAHGKTSSASTKQEPQEESHGQGAENRLGDADGNELGALGRYLDHADRFGANAPAKAQSLLLGFLTERLAVMPPGPYSGASSVTDLGHRDECFAFGSDRLAEHGFDASAICTKPPVND